VGNRLFELEDELRRRDKRRREPHRTRRQRPAPTPQPMGRRRPRALSATDTASIMAEARRRGARDEELRAIFGSGPGRVAVASGWSRQQGLVDDITGAARILAGPVSGSIPEIIGRLPDLSDGATYALEAAISLSPLGAVYGAAKSLVDRLGVTVAIGLSGTGGVGVGGTIGAGILLDRHGVGLYGNIGTVEGVIDSIGASIDLSVINGDRDAMSGISFGTTVSLDASEGPGVSGTLVLNARGEPIGVTVGVGLSLGVPVLSAIEAWGSVNQTFVTSHSVAAGGPAPRGAGTRWSRQQDLLDDVLDVGRILYYPVPGLSGVPELIDVFRDPPETLDLSTGATWALRAFLEASPLGAIVRQAQRLVDAHNVTVAIGLSGTGGARVGGTLGGGMLLDRHGVGFYGTIGTIEGVIDSVGVSVDLSMFNGNRNVMSGVSLGTTVTLDLSEGPGLGATIILNTRGEPIGLTAQVSLSLGVPVLGAFEAWGETTNTFVTSQSRTRRPRAFVAPPTPVVAGIRAGRARGATDRELQLLFGAEAVAAVPAS
jgi:hypothetical protein